MTNKQKKLAKKLYGKKLKMMNDSQCRDVLKYLMEHGSITPDEAREHFNCWRLGARVWDLRHAHSIEITTIQVENIHNSGHHAKYILEVGA